MDLKHSARPWQAEFQRLPTNLQNGPWFHLPVTDSPEEREIRLAQIVKFSIPGTDKTGHEYLPGSGSSLCFRLADTLHRAVISSRKK